MREDGFSMPVTLVPLSTLLEGARNRERFFEILQIVGLQTVGADEILQRTELILDLHASQARRIASVAEDAGAKGFFVASHG